MIIELSVVHHYPLYLSTIDSIIIHLAPMTLDIPPDPYWMFFQSTVIPCRFRLPKPPCQKVLSSYHVWDFFFNFGKGLLGLSDLED